MSNYVEVLDLKGLSVVSVECYRGWGPSYEYDLPWYDEIVVTFSNGQQVVFASDSDNCEYPAYVTMELREPGGE